MKSSIPNFSAMGCKFFQPFLQHHLQMQYFRLYTLKLVSTLNKAKCSCRLETGITHQYKAHKQKGSRHILTFIVCSELIRKYREARFSSSMVFRGCGGYFSFSCCLTFVTWMVINMYDKTNTGLSICPITDFKEDSQLQLVPRCTSHMLWQHMYNQTNDPACQMNSDYILNREIVKLNKNYECTKSFVSYIQLKLAMPSSDLWEQLIDQNSSGSCACISQYLSTTNPSVGNCSQNEGKMETHNKQIPPWAQKTTRYCYINISTPGKDHNLRQDSCHL